MNAAYDRRPRSTEQTIHPERYPDEPVASVRLPDRSSGDWSRFDLDTRTERLGEAGLFAMFWYNDYVGGYRSADLPYSSYDYSAAPSDGWAGDRLVPYRSGDGDDAAYGYVWGIEFDDASEAGEFVRAYRTMLRLRVGAETVDGRANVYRVPDGPFADAFRVERTGSRVVITNAPTVEQLDTVRAPPR
ncbi:Hvo_1808 family surface protein [Halobaculum litoreum]|uniref:Hvo_1808 family surface protein n=1 Tax=Halobaculum litoreum TaxID=3031998 RepID=A0ABD5XUB3_9EURY